MVKLSVIIPTHNRSADVLNLLKLLDQQAIDESMAEIIVVANACTDGTAIALKNHKSRLPFQLVERKEAGASGARNAGAAIAKGRFLVFVDDDIQPAAGWLQAHLDEQEKSEGVVIGYLPYQPHLPGSFMAMLHRAWWTDKFFEMDKPSHRFGYEDLLSGNFSIPKNIFLQAGEFDSGLACREDYELGIRLIELGIPFRLSKKACGIHYDRAFSAARSFVRKRFEGRSDVIIAQRHPGFHPGVRDLYHHAKTSFRKKIFFDLAIHAPSWLLPFARSLETLLWFCEKIKWRSGWQKLNYRLHSFWYVTGMKESFESADAFRAFLAHQADPVFNPVGVDMEAGLKAICEKVDRERPAAVSFYSNGHKVLDMPGVFGKEKLRGVHLLSFIRSFPVFFMDHCRKDTVTITNEIAAHGH